MGAQVPSYYVRAIHWTLCMPRGINRITSTGLLDDGESSASKIDLWSHPKPNKRESYHLSFPGGLTKSQTKISALLWALLMPRIMMAQDGLEILIFFVPFTVHDKLINRLDSCKRKIPFIVQILFQPVGKSQNGFRIG